ncbi:MAG: HTH-type transcriptional regulator GlpR [Halorhabdus sp.]
MLPDERKRRIAELVTRRRGCSVEELSAELDVSETTIRRDLNDLEERNAIERTHGGAMPVLDRLSEYQQRTVRNREAKRAIAERAVKEIHEGQVVLFDAGSTTLEISRQVEDDMAFTAVTVHPMLAYELGDTEADTRLTGGQLKPEQHRLTGPLARQAIERMNFDLVFLGLEGIDADAGLTTAYHDAARDKELMVANSQQTAVVADHSKFDSQSIVQFADVADVDMVLTDASIPADFRDRMREADVAVVDDLGG